MKQPSIEDLKEMVLAAGEIVKSNYGKVGEIGKKGVIDLVTETDLESERFLLAEIERRFPGSSAIGEEGGGLGGENQAMWFIDPIDGTVNFAHGLPIFSISLAYQFEGQLIHGVVFNPVKDEMFYASKGTGAFLNDQPLQVSNTDSLEESLLVTGFPYDAWTNPDNNLEQFNRLALKTQGVRRLGSAALDLCFVAAGWLDGFWEIRLNAWDVAAGALIVREAGGLVTNVKGAPDFMSPPQSILAANSTMHTLILAELAE